MKDNSINYSNVKLKYLNFLKSQELPNEPFRDKMGQLKNFYIPMSLKIFEKFFNSQKTIVVGLSGGQGSGKSTISKIFKIILKEKFNLETVIFSIDDFYKTIKERKKMSVTISKLFLTRGVPGTHDTKKLFNTLNQLKKKEFKKMLIPKFDKSSDERCPKSKWKKVNKKPNIIIFEGWCVGAKAQSKSSLIKPLNELERSNDKNLIWRNYVNRELKGKYNKIFNLIDLMIFLKVPSFEHVYKWRLLQEKKLKKDFKGKKIMDHKQIKKFIMFYERITRNMLKTLNLNANIVVKIDKKHKLKSLKFN